MATKQKHGYTYVFTLSTYQAQIVQEALKLYYAIKDGKFYKIYSVMHKTIEGKEARKLVREGLKDLEILYDRQLTPGKEIKLDFHPVKSDKLQAVVENDDAYVLVEALDVYMRAFLGQLGSLTDPIIGKVEVEEYLWIKNILQNKLERFATGLAPNAFHGIYNPKTAEESMVAYDLKQVVRYRLAWDNNPGGGFGVDFDEPRQSSGTEDLATFDRQLTPEEEKKLALVREVAAMLGLDVGDNKRASEIASVVLEEVDAIRQILSHPGITEASYFVRGTPG